MTPESAHRVAQGQVRHHIAIFGSWNGSLSPLLAAPVILYRDGEPSAFHFSVNPSGYVIIGAYDNLSPVPFYSTRATFDVNRADNPSTIESWMVGRLNARAEAASDLQKRADSLGGASGSTGTSGRIDNAWAYFDRLGGDDAGDDASRSLIDGSDGGTSDIVRGATVAPLLATAWGQDTPYNLETPDDSCASGHTLTGCVATAWAQVLKYWQWPPQSTGGEGTHAYTWVGNSVEADLGVDFSNTEAYQWSEMPNDLTAAGTTAGQKDAVSKLIYYLAVSAEMDFGCPESAGGSASARWADEVLDTHFKYKTMDASNNRLVMSDYSAAQWFSIMKNELDQDPPRPIIFSIGSPSGWHEVVIDGYQEGVADKVHINFGWDGNYDAYYDVTDDNDFNTSGINWDVENNQIMVIGIEPDNTPPIVQAGDDAVAEELAAVTLSVVSASDPEGVGVSRYQWTQISGSTATIDDSASSTPTITTPDVHATSELVFQVKAYDASHAFGTDTCTITVNNTDGSTTTTPPSSIGGSNSGGGGGCFLYNLIH
ncbi:MAG: C10 family peptidase [Desulfobacteraceae bacterium]